MHDLWKIIGQLAANLHADRIASVADAIRKLGTSGDFEKARQAFGPNIDPALLDRFRDAWTSLSSIGPQEVAAALDGAAGAADAMDRGGSVELVWTGPKTDLIPIRRTEQVILEVIESATREAFLVTYVFYKASSIVDALNAANRRDVKVGILLESSADHGGTVQGDSVKSIAEAVPGATVYVWSPSARKSVDDASSAAVHAKCVVADRRIAFITSANLTSAALERNMELGLLIRGGPVPGRLQSHLDALATTKVIERWK